MTKKCKLLSIVVSMVMVIACAFALAFTTVAPKTAMADALLPDNATAIPDMSGELGACTTSTNAGFAIRNERPNTGSWTIFEWTVCSDASASGNSFYICSSNTAQYSASNGTNTAAMIVGGGGLQDTLFNAENGSEISVMFAFNNDTGANYYKRGNDAWNEWYSLDLATNEVVKANGIYSGIVANGGVTKINFKDAKCYNENGDNLGIVATHTWGGEAPVVTYNLKLSSTAQEKVDAIYGQSFSSGDAQRYLDSGLPTNDRYIVFEWTNGSENAGGNAGASFFYHLTQAQRDNQIMKQINTVYITANTTVKTVFDTKLGIMYTDNGTGLSLIGNDLTADAGKTDLFAGFLFNNQSKLEMSGVKCYTENGTNLGVSTDMPAISLFGTEKPTAVGTSYTAKGNDVYVTSGALTTSEWIILNWQNGEDNSVEGNKYNGITITDNASKGVAAGNTCKGTLAFDFGGGNLATNFFTASTEVTVAVNTKTGKVYNKVGDGTFTAVVTPDIANAVANIGPDNSTNGYCFQALARDVSLVNVTDFICYDGNGNLLGGGLKGDSAVLSANPVADSSAIEGKNYYKNGGFTIEVPASDNEYAIFEYTIRKGANVTNEFGVPYYDSIYDSTVASLTAGDSGAGKVNVYGNNTGKTYTLLSNETEAGVKVYLAYNLKTCITYYKKGDAGWTVLNNNFEARSNLNGGPVSLGVCFNNGVNEIYLDNFKAYNEKGEALTITTDLQTVVDVKMSFYSGGWRDSFSDYMAEFDVKDGDGKNYKPSVAIPAGSTVLIDGKEATLGDAFSGYAVGDRTALFGYPKTFEADAESVDDVGSHVVTFTKEFLNSVLTLSDYKLNVTEDMSIAVYKKSMANADIKYSLKDDAVYSLGAQGAPLWRYIGNIQFADANGTATTKNLGTVPALKNGTEATAITFVDAGSPQMLWELASNNTPEVFPTQEYYLIKAGAIVGDGVLAEDIIVYIKGSGVFKVFNASHEFAITYDNLDGKTNPNASVTTFNYADGTISLDPIDDANFAGWTIGGEKVTEIDPTDFYGDVTVSANWFIEFKLKEDVVYSLSAQGVEGNRYLGHVAVSGPNGEAMDEFQLGTSVPALMNGTDPVTLNFGWGGAGVGQIFHNINNNIESGTWASQRYYLIEAGTEFGSAHKITEDIIVYISNTTFKVFKANHEFAITYENAKGQVSDPANPVSFNYAGEKTVVLNALPDVGTDHTFSYWTLNGEEVTEFNVTDFYGPITIQAHWISAQKPLTVTVDEETPWGTVNVAENKTMVDYEAEIVPDGNVLKVGLVEITATANDADEEYSYYFKEWVYEGMSVGAEGLTVKAVFKRVERVAVNATIKVDGSASDKFVANGLSKVDKGVSVSVNGRELTVGAKNITLADFVIIDGVKYEFDSIDLNGATTVSDSGLAIIVNYTTGTTVTDKIVLKEDKIYSFGAQGNDEGYRWIGNLTFEDGNGADVAETGLGYVPALKNGTEKVTLYFGWGGVQIFYLGENGFANKVWPERTYFLIEAGTGICGRVLDEDIVVWLENTTLYVFKADHEFALTYTNDKGATNSNATAITFANGNITLVDLGAVTDWQFKGFTKDGAKITEIDLLSVDLKNYVNEDAYSVVINANWKYTGEINDKIDVYATSVKVDDDNDRYVVTVVVEGNYDIQRITEKMFEYDFVLDGADKTAEIVLDCGRTNVLYIPYSLFGEYDTAAEIGEHTLIIKAGNQVQDDDDTKTLYAVKEDIELYVNGTTAYGVALLTYADETPVAVEKVKIGSELALKSIEAGYKWIQTNGSEVPENMPRAGLSVKKILETYTITYNGVKGTNSNPTTFTVETADITLQSLANANGYVFVGWYKNGVLVEKIEKGSETSDITLEAKWQLTVTIDLDGGVCDGLSATLIKDENVNVYALVKNSTPTKEGYTFKGWAYADGSAISDNDKLTNPLTIKAVWEKNAEEEPEKKAGGCKANMENTLITVLFTLSACAVAVVIKRRKEEK